MNKHFFCIQGVTFWQSLVYDFQNMGLLRIQISVCFNVDFPHPGTKKRSTHFIGRITATHLSKVRGITAMKLIRGIGILTAEDMLHIIRLVLSGHQHIVTEIKFFNYNLLETRSCGYYFIRA